MADKKGTREESTEFDQTMESDFHSNFHTDFPTTLSAHLLDKSMIENNHE
jgi:hypothetical protein